MIIAKIRLLIHYLIGFFHVFLHAMVLSILLVWALQMIALLFGETHDWTPVLAHLFLSLSFLAFFPGQQVWTYRLADRNGVMHTIVGREDDDGMPRR